MPIRLGSSSEATIAVDDRGIIVAWNDAAHRVLGHRPQDAIGKPCHELLHGLSPSGLPICGPECAVVDLCRRGGAARRFEMVVLRPDGVEVWCDVISVTVYDEHDRPLAVHVFNESASARRLEAVAADVARRLSSPPRANGQRSSAPDSLLTPRETDVLRLLADGVHTDAIAQQLNLSRATVRNHVQSLITKLGAHSRLEAVVRAIQAGLLGPP